MLQAGTVGAHSQVTAPVLQAQPAGGGMLGAPHRRPRSDTQRYRARNTNTKLPGKELYDALNNSRVGHWREDRVFPEGSELSGVLPSPLPARGPYAAGENGPANTLQVTARLQTARRLVHGQSFYAFILREVWL